MERYTKIPNSVMDWLISGRTGMTPKEKDLLLLIFRYTYGFQRDRAVLSNRFIATIQGGDPSNVQKTMMSLERKGLIESDTQKARRTVILKKERYRLRDDGSKSGVATTPEVSPAENRGTHYPGTGVLTTPKIYKKRKGGGGSNDPGSSGNDDLSSLEESFVDLSSGYGFPDPVSGYEAVPGKEFDFAYPEHRLLVEIDGGLHIPTGNHCGPENVAKDHRWSEKARAAGWTVFRFTRDDLHSLSFIEALKGYFQPDSGYSYSRFLSENVIKGRQPPKPDVIW